jgi:serine phosphatase RsbU (regulator of sigma subunit)
VNDITEIQKLKLAVKELSVLNDISTAVSTTHDLDQVIELIVHECVNHLNVEQGAIMLLDQNETDDKFHTIIREFETETDIIPYHFGVQLSGWMVRNQKPLLINDVPSDDRFTNLSDDEFPIKSILSAPLKTKGRLIGVLNVFNKISEDGFTLDDQRILSIIATQSAQVVENARLYDEALIKRSMEKELEVARSIQYDLLPQTLPKLEGVEFARYYQPASHVAGDYYDYFNINKYQTGVILADVCGKGPSAGMIMTMLKGVLYSLAPRYESIQRIALEINSTLSMIIPPEIFITMALLKIDMKGRKIMYTNAGHPPIIHVNKRMDICEVVELSGCAINVMSKPKYSQMEISFSTDSIFVVYTDGIIESTNDAEELFGIERLLHTVQKHCEKSAEDIKDQVVYRIKDFSSCDTFEDDLAMIVLKVI